MRRWLPVLALAFVVGALFRLGNELGIAVLRMFGTQGIVVIGILVALNLKRLQTEDGLRRLEEAIKALPPDVRVQPLGEAGRLPVWLLEGSGRRVLLGASDVANSVRSGRATRLLLRQADQVLQAAKERLGAVEGLTAALVLLRRAAGADQALEGGPLERPVSLVNPESIGRLFENGS